MKSKRAKRWVDYAIITVFLTALSPLLSSCGATRSYWGIENSYDWGDDGHYHKPPKKHKKHKKHHEKHHHHRHHHDD